MGGHQVHGDPVEARKIQFLGLEQSLYSAKAHAYLIWKGVPFEYVVISDQIMKKVIIPRAGWNVMPALLDNEARVFVQDTADIIDYMDIKYPQNSALPPVSCPKQRLFSYIMELFADQWFMVPAWHYRWSYPEQRPFVAYEFSRNESSRHPGDRASGIVARVEKTAMKFMGGAAPFLGVSRATIPKWEEMYLRFLDAFDEHLKWHHYLLGGRPTLADFALMGPFAAHLLRDPVPYAVTRLRAPRVAEWMERCNRRTASGGERFHVLRPDGNLVLPERSTDVLDQGELVPGDAIPETLLPILRIFFELQVPVLTSTAKLATELFKRHADGKEVPRGIGMHDFTIYGVTSQRVAATFDLWKAQRVTDELRRCQRGGAAGEARAFFAQFGEQGMAMHDLDLSGCRTKRVPGTKSLGNNLYKDPSGSSPTIYVRPEFQAAAKL